MLNLPFFNRTLATMKSFRILSVFTLGAIACSAAFAQSNAEKFIRAYYAKDDALMLRMDFAGWRKLKVEISTSDYLSYGKQDKTGSVVSRRPELTNLREWTQDRGPLIESVPNSITHVDHLTIRPTTILATVTSSGEMKTKKLPQDGKTHTIGGTTKSVDTWVKVGGSWKMKMTKRLFEKGKLI